MRSKIVKMISIFERRQKKQLVLLGFIILAQALLELLGVSVVLPLINIVIQPETLTENRYVSVIMEFLHLDTTMLIVLICASIILVYIIKNIFLLYMTDFQYKFTYYGRRDLSNRFMKCYLLQDYPFHLAHNSAELIRDISTDTEMFYTTVLNFLQMISELVISFCLLCYLMITDIAITIGVALSMGVVLLLFTKKFKGMLVSLGNERRYYSYKMTQNMQQGFGGIKEIKISGRESFFLQEFSDSANGFAEANRKNLFLNAAPKPLMEALCVTGLMVVVAIKIISGTDTTQFVGVLAVFAVAAFKLLPSVNKISGYIASILHNGVVIDEVYDKIKMIRHLEAEYRERQDGKLDFQESLVVEDISFWYPASEDAVLEHVSVKIEKNQSVAFIGPSGAGKTTLVDIILGLLTPQTGRIMIDSYDVQEVPDQWHRIVGYIPQNIYMLDDTIRNNVRFGDEEPDAGDRRIWRALEEAQLADFIRTLPEGLDTMIGEAGVRLSGGQRQRIGIARALYRAPQVLVLDEATSALDNETEAAVMESIEHLQGKLTIIIIAHRLTTIRNCDKVYEIDDKKIREVQKA